MAMKNTILSKKDVKLLEDVIVQYGRIVSFWQLWQIFKKEYSLAEAKNRISQLSKIGWLIRIKKGLYVVITDIGSLATNDVSMYTISQVLNKDSYISFTNALQYHGMFDQMLSTIGAVTFKRARRYSVKGTEIKFFKIKKELYFGFSRERSDIGMVNIAVKEKAVLDILYFRSNTYYVSLIWEMLKEYKDNFDFNLLKRYVKKFGLDIIRQVGFFLDRIGVDTQDLARLVVAKNSYSRMTKESRKFDSKWRLYFDDKLIN